MKKQSQITYHSCGFFSSGLQPESSSSSVPESLKLKVLDGGDATAANLRFLNRVKQSHLMPIFTGFFAAGLPPEPSSSRRRNPHAEDHGKSAGSFSWRILE
jgi:hypothetical protein